MNKDTLPSIIIYSDLLHESVIKFKITRQEARKRYGLYTIAQWEELLGKEINQ